MQIQFFYRKNLAADKFLESFVVENSLYPLWNPHDSKRGPNPWDIRHLYKTLFRNCQAENETGSLENSSGDPPVKAP